MPCAIVVAKDPTMRHQLEDQVRQYLYGRPELWQVTAFPSCEDLCAFYDIAIISVDDGLKDATQLRERDKRMTILLVADTEKYAFQSYDLSISAYLLKPVNQNHLEQGVETALHKLNRINSYADLPTESGLCREDIRGILYIQNEGKTSRVFTLNGDYSIFAPLHQLHLPKHFIPCEDKLINLAHLTQMCKKSIYFYDLSLPITRRGRKQILSHLPAVVPSARSATRSRLPKSRCPSRQT